MVVGSTKLTEKGPHSMHENSNRVFSADETAFFFINLEARKVLALKGNKTVFLSLYFQN